jgi:hypothetical protein
MKTQIIRLENFDDLGSIRDRLSAVTSPHVLLVFPRRRPPKLTLIELTLLQRTAAQQGAVMGLVTISDRIKDLAGQADIPVFASIPAATRSQWPAVQQRAVHAEPSLAKVLDAKNAQALPMAQDLPRWLRIVMFIAGVLAVAGLAVFLLPAADVVLKPERKVQTLSMKLLANPQVTQVLSSGEIPLEFMHISLSGSLDGATKGKSDIAAATARGTLNLTNLTEEPVEIPAGTIFRSSNGTQYQSTAAATLPAGPGEQGTVRVAAMSAGTAGNAPADTIKTIEGELGLRMIANNDLPISGGSDQKAFVVTQSDVDQLKASLLQDLFQDALTQAETQAGQEVVVLTDSLRLVEDPQAAVTPPLGAAAEQLTVSLQAEYQVAQVKKADLIAAARSGLEANLNPGLVPVDATIEVNVEHAQVSEDLWTLTVTAQQALIPALDKSALQTAVSGLDLNHAQAVLNQQYSLSEPAHIQCWPVWWPRMPFFAARINVKIQ